MSELPEQESLYLEAKRLIKAKDFFLASTLLKQILEEDDGYKDASRLLSSIVQKKRYRWYKDWRVWGGVLVPFVGLSALIFLPRLLTSKPQQIEPSSIPASSLVFQVPVPTPTKTENPANNNPTFSWKRINSLKEFEREEVTSVTVYPKDPSIIYAATANAGIYKTIDGGKSWTPVLNGLMDASFTKIIVNSENPAWVVSLSNQGQIYTTEDGGENWVIKHSAYNGQKGLLVQDPSDSQRLVTIENGIIITSQDWGSNWSTLSYSQCIDGFVKIEIDPANSDEWTAISDDGDVDNKVCPGGVYRSSDGGKTWQNPLISHHNITDIDISRDFIYLLTGRSAEVYVSPDRGLTWNGPYSPNGDRCIYIKADQNDSRLAYCLLFLHQEKKSELWMTNDAGMTWSKRSTLGFFGNRIEMIPSLPDQIITAGYGLDISKDKGLTWESRQNGLGSREFALVFDPWEGTKLFAYDRACAYYSRLSMSIDTGSTFEDIYAPSRYDACDLAFGYGNQIFRWQYYWIFNSSDFGKKWEGTFEYTGSDFINAFGVSPFSDGTMLYSLMWKQGIFKSTDGGVTWSLVNEASDTQRIFYFTAEGSKRVYSIASDIMVSDDLGSTWRTCSDVGATLNRHTANLAVDPDNDDVIYLATADRGVLRSTNGCASWSNLNNGLSNLSVTTIAVNPIDPQKLYAGTVSGAFVSLDRGKSWFKVKDGLLGATIIYSFAISPVDGTVLAATPYGVFKLVEQD